MKNLKTSETLTAEIAAGETLTGRYGDTLAATSFTQEQSDILCRVNLSTRELRMSGWDEAWIDGVCYTFIDCDPPTAAEVELFEAALAEQNQFGVDND